MYDVYDVYDCEVLTASNYKLRCAHVTSLS